MSPAIHSRGSSKLQEPDRVQTLSFTPSVATFEFDIKTEMQP